MNIGKKYHITSDSMNIILSEKHTVKKKNGQKEIRWSTIGYFLTIQSALRYLADLKLLESGVKDLEKVAKKQEEIYHLILSLQPSLESVQRFSGGL